MSKKELLQRVKYLGHSFIKPDGKDGYAEHVVTSKHGLAKVEKLIE